MSEKSLEQLAAAADEEDARAAAAEELLCARCGFKKSAHRAASYADDGAAIRVCPTALFSPSNPEAEVL